MAVITRLSAAEVEAALAPYPVGTLDGFKEAPEGIENTNYFIRTLNEAGQPTEYVMTLIEASDNGSNGRADTIAILDCCVAAGLPVPRVLRTEQNQPESNFLGKPMLLCSRLEGMHVVNPVMSQCAAIGRFLGRFHSATQSIQSEISPYIRDQKWLEEKTDSVKRLIPLLDRVLLEESLQSVLGMLTRQDVQKLPNSVIHADLFRDNGLFNENGLSGILDFHHAGRGFCIYDVAVALNDWCRNGDGLDENRAIELLRGYASIRPLSQEELWFLPMFLLYSALAFWLSRLTIYVRTDLPAHHPVKDPDEFKRLVQVHNHDPFSVRSERLI